MMFLGFCGGSTRCLAHFNSEPPVMLFLYGDPMRCFAGFLHLEIKTYSLNRNDSIPQPPESKRDESGSNKTQKSQ
jgi:hypothetical protein